MARENKTKYAILGLLGWKPMSGYDIKKMVEQSLGNFWSESYGQIYPIIKQLAAEGLATRIVERQEGKPDRYLYTITAAGRLELRQWLAKPADPHKERVEILLKVFFGSEMPVSDNIEHFMRFRQEQLENLQRYVATEQRLMSEQSDNPHSPYWLMSVRCGQWVSRALVDWCEESLTDLQQITTEEGVASPPGNNRDN